MAKPRGTIYSLPMVNRVRDVVARAASRQLLGREAELAALQGLLVADLPRVFYISGIPGMGKSSLLQLFGQRARAAGARLIELDGHALEPTGDALIAALATALGPSVPHDLDGVIRQLEALDGRMVLVLDGYEVLRLADTWIRQALVPALPHNVRVLMAGRGRPAPAWHAQAGWDDVFETLSLGPLCVADALELMSRNGVDIPTARRLAAQVQNHPLALRLTIAALRERRDLALDEDALQRVLEQLTEIIVGDIAQPQLREAVEAAALVRRMTLPLLAALCPELDAPQSFEALRRLPFVDPTSDGLEVHEAIRPALARALRARDPLRYRDTLRAAWRQLVAEATATVQRQLWRSTADILFLIENPVVREAFFPSGATRYTVEPASAAHDHAIREIVTRHEGPEASAHLLRWWERAPGAFAVVRDASGTCVGLHCCVDPATVEPRWLAEDPLTATWYDRIRHDPLPEGQRALFLRRWLSREHGEAPSEVQAACWLDIKRIYMEMRPSLRRVYLCVVDLEPYAAVASDLGFCPLPGEPPTLDGRGYHSAVLDFGPASVDGWLARLAAAELGIETEQPLLDVASRELVLEGQRVALTPLEFEVLRYLSDREGEAVSRDALLGDIWGTTTTRGSNVVDTVIAALRRKLGDEARRVQTVTGVGYRYRRPEGPGRG